MAIRLAVVGLGKIAQDQHLPAIAASADFELVCAASLQGESPRGHTYRAVDAMFAAEPSIEAVSLCQPPQVRFEAARAALLAGKHVLLEKPPGATLSEVVALTELAQEKGLTLFAAWHSRHAPAVTPACHWLEGKTIRSATITWREDVRIWHPGQKWIWQPGGLGVFDPGINALSIATKILPPFHLTEGILSYPSNQAAPIAADLRFATFDGVPVIADFDFRQTGPQTWDIRVETEEGVLLLSKGGSEMRIDGVAQSLPHEAEYPSLYARFAELIAAGESEVDVRPLRHVADAFLRAGHVEVEAFVEEEPGRQTVPA
ncbi:Gfo/Idh/MocA family protein [Sphingomonas abietis]|uniref:Gfo/Idh/MocA family oxidoreductase n=1 Tax=Sphingomonas abietis TaxID=3012344 RepID=A0ABY7NNY1_9SPHN|nr:Gfo/Idh/MocA family oxidoreductase [Sphingomonas abietis]WBO23232.1 Gfo/Idh/MocA family oxidoreductase [Sphingomonas abietis]